VDGIRVFAVEADLIRRAHPEVLEQAPHAAGACAFLDGEGGCRIYAERPYVCRTQGLPLRWLDESEEGEIVERRDICELNEAGTPLVQLRAGECWTIGPAEEKLRNLQEAFGGGFERVSLRQLFRKPPPNA
jgi:Fe-S-cluster containining protein